MNNIATYLLLRRDASVITSGRVCYYVGTRLLLRRDAANATSGRNFGSIGKRNRLPIGVTTSGNR